MMYINDMPPKPFHSTNFKFPCVIFQNVTMAALGHQEGIRPNSYHDEAGPIRGPPPPAHPQGSSYQFSSYNIAAATPAT